MMMNQFQCFEFETLVVFKSMRLACVHIYIRTLLIFSYEDGSMVRDIT